MRKAEIGILDPPISIVPYFRSEICIKIHIKQLNKDIIDPDCDQHHCIYAG